MLQFESKKTKIRSGKEIRYFLDRETPNWKRKYRKKFFRLWSHLSDAGKPIGERPQILWAFPENMKGEEVLYKLACGSDGLSANAFVSQANNRIGICPGLVLMDQVVGQEWGPFDFLLIHEIGHIIGSVRGEATIMESIRKNYPLSDNDVMNQYLYRPYQSEISADLWVIKSFNDLNLSKEHRKMASLPLCQFSSTSNNHLPNHIRLEILSTMSL